MKKISVILLLSVFVSNYGVAVAEDVPQQPPVQMERVIDVEIDVDLNRNENDMDFTVGKNISEESQLEITQPSSNDELKALIKSARQEMSEKAKKVIVQEEKAEEKSEKKKYKAKVTVKNTKNETVKKMESKENSVPLNNIKPRITKHRIDKQRIEKPTL